MVVTDKIIIGEENMQENYDHMVIRIDPETKRRADELAKVAGKTRSAYIRDFINQDYETFVLWKKAQEAAREQQPQ